uniref:Uncharacterized protein n=1 Tax=Schmidtea mediterranea TaxID=79327 RepID=I1ZII3_SCHMD|nr:hypothetical protein [Schmidtea mediterranea]
MKHIKNTFLYNMCNENYTKIKYINKILLQNEEQMNGSKLSNYLQLLQYIIS